LWTNKQLTDGHLPQSVVKAFAHFEKPLAVAGALVKAGLWETTATGYRIHDFHDYNPTADDAKARRKQISDARSKAGLNGARVHWQRVK
jgi:hypothetical protein